MKLSHLRTACYLYNQFLLGLGSGHGKYLISFNMLLDSHPKMGL